MPSLPALFGRFFKKTAQVPATPVPARQNRPVAYVDCGRGIEFTADFIVGMTLAQLLEWLKECCSTRLIDGHIEIEWLPKRLRLASGKEVGMEYVICAGDVLILSDPALPAPRQQKLLN